MTDTSLLEASASLSETEPSTETEPRVPSKFWDAATGQVRTDALLRSYQELERKLGAQPRPDVPDAPDGYEIALSDPRLEVDKEVNARLHEAGFTRKQAQLVYDLALERLGPIVDRLAATFETQRQVDRLTDHFGGPEQWGELSQQLAAWGRSNLPQDVFQALSSSFEGVLALHKMMGEARSEPGIGRAENRGEEMLTEARLKEMMMDRRYWRDHDPAYVAKVTRGYERLFPSEG